jgi:hypothetical protein
MPGSVFPRIVFIGTNLDMPSQAVERSYDTHGMTEQLIKESKLCGPSTTKEAR